MGNERSEIANVRLAVRRIELPEGARTSIPTEIVNQAAEVMTQLGDLLPPGEVSAACTMDEDKRRAVAMQLVVKLGIIGSQKRHVR